MKNRSVYAASGDAREPIAFFDPWEGRAPLPTSVELSEGNVYDPASQLLYMPIGDEEEIPSDLSPDAARRYAKEILDVFSDYPISDEDRSVILSILITIVMRECLPIAPLNFLDASSKASGKTLLACCLAVIGGGTMPAVIPWRSDPLELEKTICSAVLQGSRIILLDNANCPVGGAMLDSLLTSERATLRELGGANISVDTKFTIMVTGNGLQFIGDTNSRVVGLRIIPKCANPEERTGFKQPFLEKWVADHSAHLGALLLGITEAYRVAGRPQYSETGFRFAHWNHYVRNCVLWLGWPDPLTSRERVKARDTSSEFKTEVAETLLKAKTLAEKDGNTFGGMRTRDIGAKLPKDTQNEYKEFSGEFGAKLDKALLTVEDAYVVLPSGTYRIVSVGKLGKIYSVEKEGAS